jgi:hypothetical protein
MNGVNGWRGIDWDWMGVERERERCESISSWSWTGNVSRETKRL